eukprot:scaffold81906_cov20-Tisochrysis_lutea.AAC.1
MLNLEVWKHKQAFHQGRGWKAGSKSWRQSGGWEGLVTADDGQELYWFFGHACAALAARHLQPPELAGPHPPGKLPLSVCLAGAGPHLAARQKRSPESSKQTVWCWATGPIQLLGLCIEM